MNGVPPSAYPGPEATVASDAPVPTVSTREGGPLKTVAPLRCPAPCRKLLAEQITSPYRIMCPRCKTVTTG